METTKRNSKSGKRLLNDLPTRNGQNVRGGVPAAQTTTLPKETLTIPYSRIEWTYT